MARKDDVGRDGEELASAFLSARGFTILERNWRCSAGEIDIVATSGDLAVFVEVKSRSGTGYGHPFEALTPPKISRLYRLASLWRREHAHSGPFRIDAIAVLRPGSPSVSIEHLVEVR